MLKATRNKSLRLLAFLLRSGQGYTFLPLWSHAHMCWLADIKMAHRFQQIVLQEYIDSLNQCSSRIQRLSEQVRQLLHL